MNAAGLRRCVEEKEAMATAYDQLNAKCAKECDLYERDLERAMESCDDLARENSDLRARLHQNAEVSGLPSLVPCPAVTFQLLASVCLSYPHLPTTTY